MIAFLLALVLALPTPLPDLTIRTDSPGPVASGTTFDHSYTVQNQGSAAAKYQTHDQFSTSLDVAGVICNGTLGAGESVTLTEVLRMKQVPWSGSVVVNRALRSIVAESDYGNNAAFWSVAVLP